MEYTNTTKRLNNEGFSLVEVLVALAVSGIVVVMIAALMTNGSFLFKTENSKINLQNEMQLVNNYVSETILEAKTLNILSDSTGTYIYTGRKDTDNSLLPAVDGSPLTTERILTHKEGSLYITNSYIPSLTKGYMISNCVKSFDVKVDESCKVTAEDGSVYYTNPIILNVTLIVSEGDREKTKEYVYKVRNKIKKITIDNVEYEVK